MLFIEAIESVRCFDEGVIESVADANIGSIMGIGYPPWTGGVLQYINGSTRQPAASPASSPARASSPHSTASASSRLPRSWSALNAASPTADELVAPPPDLADSARGWVGACRSTPPDNLAQRCVGARATAGTARLWVGALILVVIAVVVAVIAIEPGRLGRRSKPQSAATDPSRQAAGQSTTSKRRSRCWFATPRRSRTGTSTRALCRSSSTTPSDRRRRTLRSRVCMSPTGTSRRRWPGFTRTATRR